jgi:hypothetical protein
MAQSTEAGRAPGVPVTRVTSVTPPWFLTKPPTRPAVPVDLRGRHTS